jgi:hypothetical protein
MVLTAAAGVADRSEQTQVAAACKDVTAGLNTASERIRSLIAQDQAGVGASAATPGGSSVCRCYLGRVASAAAILMLALVGTASAIHVHMDTQLRDARAAQKDTAKRLARLLGAPTATAAGAAPDRNSSPAPLPAPPVESAASVFLIRQPSAPEPSPNAIATPGRPGEATFPLHLPTRDAPTGLAPAAASPARAFAPLPAECRAVLNSATPAGSGNNRATESRGVFDGSAPNAADRRGSIGLLPGVTTMSQSKKDRNGMSGSDRRPKSRAPGRM